MAAALIWAEQKLTAGNQLAQSLLTSGSAGTHGHILVVSRPFVFFSFFVGCMLHSHYPTMAVSLAPQFLLCVNMPQYNKICEDIEDSVKRLKENNSTQVLFFDSQK
jgi:hypothetical protein